MNQIGTVIPEDGLRVRSGASTDHPVLGVLEKGEQVALVERAGEWWRVDSRFGPGFVHADFILAEPRTEEVVVPVTEGSYTCVPGDTLSGIGAKLSIDFMEIALLNGMVDPFVIEVGQVLRLPSPGCGPRQQRPSRSSIRWNSRVRLK